MKRILGRRGWRITGLVAMVATFWVPQISHGGPTRKGVDRTQLIGAIVQRLVKLQNLMVHYQDEVYLPKISLPAMPVIKQYHLKPRYGYRFYKCEFRFFHGRAFYERNLMPITLAEVGTPGGPLPATYIKSLESFIPSRAETLYYAYNSPHRPVGAIMNVDEERLPYSIIDLALGLRAFGSQHFISARDIRRMSMGPLRNGHLVMWQQEGHGILFLWNWLWDQGKVELQSFTEKQGNAICENIQCSGFHAIRGLLLPSHIEKTDWNPIGSHDMYRHIVVTNITYRIGAKSNTAKSYYIVFPRGAGVLDERINQQFNVESGPRRLTDKAIFKLQEHYDALPGRAMLPDANTAKASLKTPAPPIASSAVPATGTARSGVPRWLLEVIAALATGGLAVVVWLIIKKVAKEEKK
ncbi:MAG: hypothetical protein ACYCUV_02145 [Phycisphaerae bacterium]